MAIANDEASRAREIFRSALVWDNHACLPLRTDAAFLPELERYRKAGISVVSINVGCGRMEWAEHLLVLSFMRQWLAVRSDAYCLVSTVDDLYRCKADGRLGVVFDIEGMYPVQENLPLVQTFYELGVRWMLIAYNQSNAAGGGCLDADSGLTPLGRAIIDEMERVGMLLCLSHTGTRTAWDALEHSRNPVIFSHSNPNGDTPHPRNVTDDLIRACARKGGVVGLSGFGAFLGSNVDLANSLLRQLRYVLNLVDSQHVGLGLDYVFDKRELGDFVRLNPSLLQSGESVDSIGMLEPEALEFIVEGLVRDLLSEDQIRGILGGNWLRVATSVWK